MSSPRTKASHRDVAARADAAEQRDLSEIATPEPAPRARRRRPPRALVLAVLAVLFAVLLWVDVNAGYRQISLEQLWGVITGTGEKSVAFTLVNLRLPRVLTAMLVGIGLGLSGCLLQGVTRNDMAEPGVLGINAGAGLFVAAFFVFFPQLDLPTEFVLPALAFMGSLLVAFLDYRLAVTRRGMSPRRFLLVGIAIATAVSSFTTMLMLRLPDSDYAFVQNWIAGNIWGATWPNVAMLAIGLGVLALIAFYKSRTLNVLGLGEQTATGLGVNVRRQTVGLLGVSIAMSSLCCAVGGGLSFVGLVCPHLARRLVGPDYRVLIPTTLLVGAVLMCASDIVSRTLIAPNEIPIGIVAAIIGAPYFLYLLTKA